MSLAVVAGAGALSALAPLLAAHRRGVATYDEGVPCSARLAALSEDHDAVLVVGDRRRAPSTVLPGTLLRRADGRPIPLGWLPDLGADLGRYAARAAAVHRRPPSPPAVVLLGQWHPRYLDLSRRTERLLVGLADAPPVHRWTSDRILRHDLLAGLGAGFGLAIYLGHGRPSGWTGYRGLRGRHLRHVAGEPMGALLNLTCLTASRRGVGLSFAESVAIEGVAAASLGAIRSTDHLDNARWAVGLALALQHRPASLGEWVAASLPLSSDAIAPWRIVGDPLAPLDAHADCALAAARVEADWLEDEG